MIRKKLIVSALLAVLTLLLVFYFQKGPESVTPWAQAHIETPSRAVARKPDSVRAVKDLAEPTRPPAKNPSDKEDSPSSQSFSYSEAKRNLQKLEGEYPGSKKQLIKIITSEDLYKSQLSEPKPHSAEEWTQMQRGAIKVMALRTLISKGQSPQETQANLQNIIDSAQDPTIKNLAQAALESAKEGRPFFKDLLNAIEDMPI